MEQNAMDEYVPSEDTVSFKDDLIGKLFFWKPVFRSEAMLVKVLRRQGGWDQVAVEDVSTGQAMGYPKVRMLRRAIRREDVGKNEINDAQIEPETKRPKVQESLASSVLHSFEKVETRTNKPILYVKKLSEHAHLPVQGVPGSAGYDLAAAYAETIPPHGKALIKTDLAIAVPEGHYGRIAPRSSLAWKNHIDVGAGVLDFCYTGPVGVVLFNHAAKPFEISAGDRIAQLIIEVICHPEIVEVDELAATDRGSGGFGSTGK